MGYATRVIRDMCANGVCVTAIAVLLGVVVDSPIVEAIETYRRWKRTDY